MAEKREMTAEEKLEWLWKNCKIIYWVAPQVYPIEHSAVAKKDSRAMIEHEMQAHPFPVLPTDAERLDWLDKHCAFVADHEYAIGPFKVGELRKMADAGIAADKAVRSK